ncbi:hypothetical protein ZTR_09140 [Talaromyces verruculosus]|nr:hypothetical protein ZTR_09140 [Talaromyces verruculosus]
MVAALASVVLFLALASAEQAVNLNITAAVAETYHCGEACFHNLQTATPDDLATVGTDFDFNFYATADNFSTSQAGDLLKLQVLDGSAYDIDSGLTAYRIQYTSKDWDGSLVPVTGFIAFPTTPPTWSPPTVFPLVAFGHGTLGVYRGCAPSNGPKLYDYNTWSLITQRGYAVVATDYAGLGNNYTDHKWCTFPAHANDLYYSVIAVRKAFKSILSHKWLSVGHSQGGAAVWKLAEQIEELQLSSNTTSGGKYLGTVAISPAAKLRDMAYNAINNILPLSHYHQWEVIAELPLAAIGLKRVYPDFNASTYVAEPYLKRMELGELTQTCTDALTAMTLDLPYQDLYSENLLMEARNNSDDNAISKWQKAVAPASGGLATEPVLVVQGLADISVVANVTINAHREACTMPGYEAYLLLYTGQDHGGTVISSSQEWLDWIADRFAGKPTPGGCSSTTRTALDPKNVRKELEIDLTGFVVSPQ